MGQQVTCWEGMGGWQVEVVTEAGALSKCGTPCSLQLRSSRSCTGLNRTGCFVTGAFGFAAAQVANNSLPLAG